MSNTLTRSYITKLPELSPKLRELQWSVEYWQKAYAEAGLQKELAWKLYDDAIEDEQSHEFIDEVFITTKILDDICRDAWGHWQDAKAILLALKN